MAAPAPPASTNGVAPAANEAEFKHVDLNGNVFELPTFTMKQIHDSIPAHCFKPSTLRSMAYVVRDFFYMSVLAYVAVTYIPLLPNGRSTQRSKASSSRASGSWPTSAAMAPSRAPRS
jgi:omega-6 fatty acid desaturase (delta-12 desaturase)